MAVHWAVGWAAEMVVKSVGSSADETAALKAVRKAGGLAVPTAG
jgi:predicted HAD superfamily phosphohydrolase